MLYSPIGRFIALCIGMGWGVTTWAATTAALDLTGLAWAQIGLGVALATWGGLTSAAQRLVAAIRAGVKVQPLWPGIVADILASGGSGLIVYSLGAWQLWDRSLVSVLLFLGGYSGTRLLEPLATTIAAKLVDVLGRLVGPKPD